MKVKSSGRQNFKHTFKAFLCFERGRTQTLGNVNCKAHEKSINSQEEIITTFQV